MGGIGTERISEFVHHDHLCLGDHVCSFFDNEEDQAGVICAYARDAFANNEKFIYVHDSLSRVAVLDTLRRGGIDTARHLSSGQLVVIGPENAYLRTDGRFEIDAMLRFCGEQAEEALSQGFDGVKAAAEMSWALKGADGSERLAEYEARLNDIFPGGKVTTICQYDMRLFPDHTLKDVLRSHHIVIIGQDHYDNKFFDPAYRGGPMHEEMRKARFEDMLDEVSRPSAFEAYPSGSGYRCLRTPEEYDQIRIKEKLESSQLYLDVLLHDVNNVNMVVRGYAELLLDRSSSEDRPLLLRLIKSVDHNFSVIRNVSNLMQMQSGHETIAIDLDPIVRAEIAHFPDFAITYSGTRSLVKADGMLSEVVHNLIGNAVKFGGQSVHINVIVKEEGDRHLLIVEDDGPGVSNDLKVTVFDRMKRGRTTKAGKGLGLYIVKELAHRYGGDVGVEDRVPGESGDGARFIVWLRKA